MLKSYPFPIKGTFYYAASIAIEESLITKHALFELQAEPDNAYDCHALQIFLRPPKTGSVKTNPIPATSNESAPGLLLGYVPRQLAPIISKQLHTHKEYNLQVIHRVKMGKFIEIDCLLEIQLPWLSALNLRLLAFWVQQLNHFRRLRHYLDYS